MPNAVQDGIYSQYFNSVIKMAQQEGGVSRPALMHALAISRTMADGLIARCKLRKGRIDGKTEFFYVSRGSKKVLDADGDDTDTKETTDMNEAATPSPADAKGIVAAAVGDDQPAAAPAPKGKKGKNRLPKEEQQPPSPTAATPPEAPVVAPTPVPAAPAGKTAAELDHEIVAIQACMKEAANKSNAAFLVHLAQKSHAEALGERLKVAMALRLNI